ncbi:hypothetical protein C6P45_004629 [Maudiozyma exigua]|uniref:ML-like domain-containing protein n=1 Tax=Maudiozyma exigua TaxID=34358 RepID=A0A9P6WCC3_MAUEX|nr:hypothetical protein C6P45_004629 [Kazachstania exigua]
MLYVEMLRILFLSCILFVQHVYCDQIGTLYSNSVLISTATNDEPIRGNRLYIKHAASCMINSQLNFNEFRASLIPSENTIKYKIKSFSTMKNISYMNFDIFMNGVHIHNETIRLCENNFTNICHLNFGRNDFEGELLLLDNINEIINNKIIFKFPDLKIEVFATIYDTRRMVSCLHATITNGKSVKQISITVLLSMIWSFAFCSFALLSFLGYGMISMNLSILLITVTHYFQDMTLLGMLDILFMPRIVVSWIENFEWSLGIVNLGYLQKVFSWYMKSNTIDSIQSQDSVTEISGESRTRDKLKLGHIGIIKSGDLLKQYYRNETIMIRENRLLTPQYNANFNLESGISRLLKEANITYQTFFLTSLVSFLFMVILLIIGSLIFKTLIITIPKTTTLTSKSECDVETIFDETKFQIYLKRFRYTLKGILLIYLIMIAPHVFIISMYELLSSINQYMCSGLTATFLIVGFAIVMIHNNYTVFIQGQLSMRIHHSYHNLLYDDTNFLRKYGYLYRHYKLRRYWWLTIELEYLATICLIIITTQNYGKMGCTFKFLIDLVYTITLLVFTPYYSMIANGLQIIIQIINTLNSLMYLLMSDLFPIKIGIVQTVGMFFFIVNVIVTTIMTLTVLTWTIYSFVTAYKTMKQSK